jgi:hypothetical protein
MSAAASLSGLRDIRGVEGSFLLRRPDGAVVARDGLQVVSEAALSDTSRRLSNIFEALETVSPGADEAVLRFDGLALFARRNERVLLGVLAADNASMPALRMATNLVLRQLEAVDLAPAPAPALTPTVPAAVAPAESAPRFWRGSPV